MKMTNWKFYKHILNVSFHPNLILPSVQPGPDEMTPVTVAFVRLGGYTLGYQLFSAEI